MKSASRFGRFLPVSSMPDSVTVATSVPKTIASSNATRFRGFTAPIVGASGPDECLRPTRGGAKHSTGSRATQTITAG